MERCLQFVCQWTRFHFLLAKSKTSGLVRASVIVDLLWPLAQRGPDQIGHFDQNLIGYNGVIPSSAGYGRHMTPNKNHMLLSVKTDALMDVSEQTPLDGPVTVEEPQSIVSPCVRLAPCTLHRRRRAHMLS